MVDPRHLIRVAYGFESIHLQRIAEMTPDELPTNAKILVLRIDSAPIASFLRNRVDVELTKDHVLELFTPFRILLRHLKAIREHLAFLEEKFR